MNNKNGARLTNVRISCFDRRSPLFQKNDLIKEREKPGPGTKWWDWVFFAFYVPLFFAVYMVAALLVIRTYLEDTTLQKELTGYVDYAHRVRYRLLPGIW